MTEEQYVWLLGRVNEGGMHHGQAWPDLRNKIETHAKALVELYQASQWQPIETAPKDVRDSDPDCWVLIGKWEQTNYNKALFRASLARWDRQYSYWVHYGEWFAGDRIGFFRDPTHWRPNPEAPK